MNRIIIVICATSFLVGLAIISSIASILAMSYDGYSFYKDDNLDKFVILITMLIVGAILGSGTILGLIFYKKILNDTRDIITGPWFNSRNFVSTIIFMAGIIASIVLAVAFVIPMLETDYSLGENSFLLIVWLHHVLTEHTNGLVGLFVSVVTVLGFYFTIKQLEYYRSKIENFKQLLERIVILSKSSSAEDPLYIISYTPAIGFLARGTNEWIPYYQEITKSEGRSMKTIILTQKMDQLKQWHQKFRGRKTHSKVSREVTQEMINEANEKSELIKTSITTAAKAVGGNNPSSNKTFYIEVDYENLPGYYAFFNSTRAIIVTPLFLPLKKYHHEGDLKQHIPILKDQKEKALKKFTDSPNMIGFETSEQSVIDNLKMQFQYIQAANTN